uniref:Uncharacterized protein n=1 Tax=Kalanchoe fedtschenkoi TaxID=63787 RepID=A0A7N0RJN5_KALFE
MDHVHVEEADVALKAQAHVWNQMYAFINSASLKCAVELGIPDIIHKHGKPMALTDLAAALHSNTSTGSCALSCINSGFFVSSHENKNREGGGGEASYALAPPAYYLLDSNPCSLKPYLLAMLDPVAVKPWGQLSRCPWEAMRSDSKLNNLFNKAMASDARLVAKALLSKDEHGAFPDMDCTNFDMPHVVAGLEGVRNLKHVPGDMFESIPPAHAILLKWVLHDWDDEHCVKILKNCKEAIVKNGCKGGKVMIIDMVVSCQHHQPITPNAFETQLFFYMRMMCLVSGKEREEEWAKLFEEAGLTKYKITPMLGLRSLIEVFP